MYVSANFCLFTAYQQHFVIHVLYLQDNNLADPICAVRPPADVLVLLVLSQSWQWHYSFAFHVTFLEKCLTWDTTKSSRRTLPQSMVHIIIHHFILYSLITIIINIILILEIKALTICVLELVYEVCADSIY